MVRPFLPELQTERPSHQNANIVHNSAIQTIYYIYNVPNRQGGDRVHPTALPLPSPVQNSNLKFGTF